MSRVGVLGDVSQKAEVEGNRSVPGAGAVVPHHAVQVRVSLRHHDLVFPLQFYVLVEKISPVVNHFIGFVQVFGINVVQVLVVVGIGVGVSWKISWFKCPFNCSPFVFGLEMSPDKGSSG